MLHTEVLPAVASLLSEYTDSCPFLKDMDTFFVNRNLYGQVSLVLHPCCLAYEENIRSLEEAFVSRLGIFARRFIYEEDVESFAYFRNNASASFVFFTGAVPFLVVERTLDESAWSRCALPDKDAVPVSTFFALSDENMSRAEHVCALAAETNALLVDMEGISLPRHLSSRFGERFVRPSLGVMDAMSLDAVDYPNSFPTDSFPDYYPSFSSMFLTYCETLRFLPLFGRDTPSPLLMSAKFLLRVRDDVAHSWLERFRRIVSFFASACHADSILLYAPSGLNETASALMLDMAPHNIFLCFSEERDWREYDDLLFAHWKKMGILDDIVTRIRPLLLAKERTCSTVSAAGTTLPVMSPALHHGKIIVCTLFQ